MKYRTRREIATWPMAKVLAAMDELKLEPEGQRVFLTDGVPDAQGCPRTGDAPHFLTASQKKECSEIGSTTLELQQQVEQGASLTMWRLQLYSEGVAAYVKSLGLAKCYRELTARKAELSTWDQRRATRREVEEQLIKAIHNEQEETET